MKKIKKILSIISILSLCALMIIGSIPFVSAASKTVSNVRQTEASSSSIKFCWDNVIGITDYQADIRQKGDTNWTTLTKYASDGNKGWGAYSLTSATVYEVRVKAKDGSWSSIVQMGTAPAKVTGLTQTSATKDSATFKWNASKGATSYQICFYYDNKERVMTTVNGTSGTVKGLSNKTSYPTDFIYVKPRMSLNGKQIMSNEECYYYNPIYDISLVPKQVSTPKISSYYYSLNELYVTASAVPYADGYQCRVLDNKGKTVSNKYSTSSLSPSFFPTNVKKNQFYKVQVRAYATIDGKKFYGSWSKAKYVHQGVELKLKNKSGSNVKVSWKKVKGATSYKVYASTKSNSGYKKVKTTKKTSITLSKINKKSIKKGKYYYVYVIANKKVGKKTYKSGTKQCYYFNKY